MPAKKQIEREDILNEAFNLVRERGMEALNMRELAHRCNCSTQPIYLCFGNAASLQIEVGRKIWNYYAEYVKRAIAEEKYPVYKAVGMSYISFAKEEKHLFKYMLMSKRPQADVGSENTFVTYVELVRKTFGFTQEQADKFQTEMWVFVHGIATMYATDFFDWQWDDVSGMVTDVFQGLMMKFKKEDSEKNGN